VLEIIKFCQTKISENIREIGIVFIIFVRTTVLSTVILIKFVRCLHDCFCVYTFANVKDGIRGGEHGV